MAGKRKTFDAGSAQVGQPGVVIMPSDGPARLEQPDIKVVDGPKWKEKAALLAFMEEPVTVVVHTTSDKMANPLPEIWVDGRVQRFHRGTNITVKRKFVEGLARSKLDGYQNEEFIDRDGTRKYRYPKSVALKYPFAVIEDANPAGRPWLEKVLAEAV